MKSKCTDRSESCPFESDMKWAKKLVIEVGPNPMPVRVSFREKGKAKARFRATVNSDLFLRDVWLRVPIYSRTHLAGCLSLRVVEEQNLRASLLEYLPGKIEYHGLRLVLARRLTQEALFLRVSLGHYCAETQPLPLLGLELAWPDLLQIVTDCRRYEFAKVDLYAEGRGRIEKLGTARLLKHEQGVRRVYFQDMFGR